VKDTAAFKQQTLFGPVEHFDVLHGLHNGAVAVAFKDGDGFHQRMEGHGEARGAVHNLAAYDDIDLYMSQNAFNPFVRKVRRLAQNVQVLTSIWCDLDYYKIPELRHHTIEDIAELVLRDREWLPEPTMVINSGRGGYLQWCFDERVHTSEKQLARWMFAMDMLVRELKPYGADSQATDASRILRVIGSTNTKSRQPVTLVSNVVGRKVNFGAFTNAVIDGTKHLRHDKPRHKDKAPRQRSFPFAPQSDIRLHLARMKDYRQLVELRGGRLTDCRKRMMYSYAVSLSWTCRSREQAEREMVAFVRDCFANPAAYELKAVANVFDIMQQAASGKVTKIWQGEQVDLRHKARNETLIARLEITADEMAALESILSRSESRKRKAERQEVRRTKQRERMAESRRQAGMVPQTEYTKQVAAGAAERRIQARLMREAGNTIAEIQAALNVSRRTVHTYLEG